MKQRLLIAGVMFAALCGQAQAEEGQKIGDVMADAEQVVSLSNGLLMIQHGDEWSICGLQISNGFISGHAEGNAEMIAQYPPTSFCFSLDEVDK